MGLVDRLRPQASRSMSPTDDQWYSPGGAFFGGAVPTSTGVPVNSDSVLRLSTVQSCVRVRAFTIAMLPCHLIEVGTKARATNYQLYEQLHDQPNPWMTAWDFWGMCEAHVCLRGNFYVYKVGLPGRPVQMLVPLSGDRVQRVEQHEDYTLTYHVRVGGEVVLIPGERIMHFRGLTLDGVNGVNPIEYARETIGLGMASTEFLGRYFGRGLHPGAVIKHPMSLSTQAHANLKQALTEKYAGLGKTHELMLIDEGMDIEFPKVTLVDAQFLDQMKFSEAQVCGLFRVPLMLIQSGDKAPTYASAEEFTRSFAMFGITPDVVNYEKVIRRDLLSPEERKLYYPKFSLDALQRANFLDRMQGYQIGVNAEIINPNEARELEDKPPYAGGNTYRTRTSTVKEAKPPDGGKKR